MSTDAERSESGAPIYRHTQPNSDLVTEPGDIEAREILELHYARHFGGGSVFHEIVSTTVHIDVHIHPPTAVRDHYVLVTNGMSERAMQTPAERAEYRHIELLLCLPPKWPISESAFQDENNYWPLRWLKTLARLPHEYNTWLGVGHTVPNGDPAVPVASGTELAGVIIGAPILFPAEALEIDVRPGKRVHLFSVLPLYAEEMELKLKEGADALFEKLDRVGVSELLDIKRKNSCRKRFGFL